MLVHLIHFQQAHDFLFELIFLIKLSSLLSKSALFTKLAISVLLAKFAYFNLSMIMIGTGTNLSTSNLSTLLFKLFKLVGTFFNLSMSNLSTSDFKLAKSVFFSKR